MKLLTENRHEYVTELIQLQPHSIMTFSQFDIKELATTSINILSNAQGFEKQILKPRNWTFRTNNKLHSKLAIGENGFIIGSWNFSNNSTQDFHEVALCISKAEAPEIYAQLCDYFEALWNRSTKKVKWEDEYT